MKGISFLTNEKNKKVAVQIDLKTLEQHEETLEDLFDAIIAEARKDESEISWEDLKKKLRKKR